MLPDKLDLAIRILCIVIAVSGARQAMLLAPGLTKLVRETTFLDKPLGCFGTWGYQDDAIGEVGLGLIAPPDKLKDVVELADERRPRCETSDDALRYWNHRRLASRTTFSRSADSGQLAAGGASTGRTSAS